LSATPGLNMFPGSLEVLPGDTSIPLLSLGQTTSTSTGSVVLLRQPSTITPQPLLIWPGASSRRPPHSSRAVNGPALPVAAPGVAGPLPGGPATGPPFGTTITVSGRFTSAPAWRTITVNGVLPPGLPTLAEKPSVN